MHNYIKANAIGEAWLLALEYIMKHGRRVYDKKGPILEVMPLIIEMMHPSLLDTILEEYGDKKYLNFLERNFTDLSPIPEWGYSYAERLYADTNQIQGVINKLKNNPFSRSATISLLVPEQDKEHTPCLTTLDFKIRNECLFITALFRSQDIGKKMYGDAVELLKMGTTMIQDLPATNVILIHVISSANIYVSDLELSRSIINSRREK